jgi:hypothetical protein
MAPAFEVHWMLTQLFLNRSNTMKLFMPAVASVALSVASLSALAMTNADYYGQEASPTAAMRTITVGPNTRAVNVQRGEIAKIVVNGHEMVWDFDGTLPSFDLRQIAPEGTIEQKLPVYIAPVPYDGNSGA